ncbi:TetR/AcrR family transcriptional regulator [Oscillatoria sp. FACHB-1407]|uniref:TetR/AcrR family transcriptional regulator n=1 Tax=Oscillatoria sp. FACHB-1407 TaxID=2692847 RepID=UPI001689AB83|nr:TetR/AcrR family transcriptional regulator [Oscillatoria sp. FACHB-1407]MBD2461442.1 TetR/AcrR family transcriptional regulator [Oscillatoria sp. FACHB-1407]
MPEKKQTKSREETVKRLVGLFRQYGYEGATLTRISEATDLGRASLYHHFPGGKEEMAQAVLEYMEQWMEANIIEPLQQDSSPGDRLQTMSATVNRLYSEGNTPCLLAVLTLGDSHTLFQQQVKAALNGWLEALAQVLIDAEIEPSEARTRAQNAILQIQGALILARGLGDTTPFQRTLEQLPEMLLSHAKSV